MLTYAIADMHGRFDLLVKAELAIHAHRKGEPSRLVVMGDYIDRGPDSAAIIKTLRRWSHGGLELVALRGNHEDMMLEVLGCPTPHLWQWWMGNGGWSTMQSYGYNQGDQLDPFPHQLVDDIAWLKTLPYYHETDKQVFVHAAVLPGLPMAEQPKEILTWECWDRNWEWGDEVRPFREADYPKHVVHGHEQWAEGPVLLESRTDLDTFAWYTGRLAIGVFDDSQGKPIDILWAEGEPHGNQQYS